MELQLKYKGVDITLRELVAHKDNIQDLKYHSVYKRLRKGMTTEEALSFKKRYKAPVKTKKVFTKQDTKSIVNTALEVCKAHKIQPSKLEGGLNQFIDKSKVKLARIDFITKLEALGFSKGDIAKVMKLNVNSVYHLVK